MLSPHAQNFFSNEYKMVMLMHSTFNQAIKSIQVLISEHYKGYLDTLGKVA